MYDVLWFLVTEAILLLRYWGMAILIFIGGNVIKPLLLAAVNDEESQFAGAVEGALDVAVLLTVTVLGATGLVKVMVTAARECIDFIGGRDEA